MKKENIVRLVKELKNANYKEVVGALVVFEILENELYYDTELEELRDEDIKTLEKIYNKFMESATITGLLNDELKEIIESEMK